LFAADVAGAREEIFDFIQRNPNNNNIIYYHGYGGFGAATVLRSIARVLPSMKDPPPKLCFGRTIYIDCSRWISNREMQRKITQELKLDQMTRGMFEEQDEEDDFNGVDLASRDTIRSVTVVIDRTLRKSRFMIIFINGSDDELDLRRFGIPEYLDCVVLWTFSKGRFMMTTDFDSIPDDMIASKIRYTDAFLYYCKGDTFKSSSEIISLFREEATNIVVAGYPYMQGTDDLAIVVYCCLYRILLLRYNSFCAVTTGCSWPPHAPIYWICDGIIQGDRAREISNSLHSELSFQCDAAVFCSVFRQLKEDPESPFIEVTDDVDYEKRPYCRWISITLKNEKLHDIQRIFERSASSIFLAFETKDRPYRLPNDLFNQSNNILGVLVLSCCAFSFVSPPFLNCKVLRFLGLVHCMDDNSVTQLEGGDCATRWECLQTLWAIDMYCTDWFEILSKEKLELMPNLMELNIEGVRCSWLTSHLLEILPYLQRLRLIKPKYEADTADMSNSSVDKINIEILDLSGDRGLTSLPAIISKANHLQVLILDGCDGLEEVVLSGNMSLRSFSFDGYGPAESHRTSSIELPPIISRPKHPVYAEKKSVVKTSKVSLKGCTQLDNLFLRGLPNLEELDLSGCAIKVLDFEAMVVDVPRLKRLFLLGCENLHAIKWGSYEQQLINQLELICIDTRPVSGRALGCFQPASSLGAQQKYFQLHAIFVDARLARSLVSLTEHYSYYTDTHPHFNISITSSATCTETIQPEATTNKAKVSGSIDHHADYHDVFTKIGNEPAPMQAFPQGPMKQLEWHTEIGNGSRNVQSEVEADPSDDNNLAKLMKPTQSLHVHDVSTYSNTMPTGPWFSLRWCRIERCPNFHAIFPPGAEEINGILKTIWASDLLMARCVWSKDVIIEDSYYNLFMGLQHLHLRCCPSLQFGLAIGAHPSFHSLETLHIIHCGQLRHVFIPWDNQHTSIKFPVLTTIHLHDLPALLQIFKATKMLAPALETIKIRGCSSLRRLPALKGRKAGMRRPTVEIEKDVWDALEWDGVDAGHHPSLYEAPVHSRYYKRHMLRTTVLR